MTDVKPGCIHPDSACGNDLMKLALLAALAFLAVAAVPLHIAHRLDIRRGWYRR